MGLKPRAEPVPDCLRCGLCCVAPYEQDVFCNVTEQDIERMPKALRDEVVAPRIVDLFASMLDGNQLDMALPTKTITIEHGLLKGSEATVCICLTGDPLHRVSCSIYEQRPRICHTAVQPGTRLCQQIRRQQQ